MAASGGPGLHRQQPLKACFRVAADGEGTQVLLHSGKTISRHEVFLFISAIDVLLFKSMRNSFAYIGLG